MGEERLTAVSQSSCEITQPGDYITQQLPGT